MLSKASLSWNNSFPFSFSQWFPSNCFTTTVDEACPSCGRTCFINCSSRSGKRYADNFFSFLKRQSLPSSKSTTYTTLKATPRIPCANSVVEWFVRRRYFFVCNKLHLFLSNSTYNCAYVCNTPRETQREIQRHTQRRRGWDRDRARDVRQRWRQGRKKKKKGTDPELHCT